MASVTARLLHTCLIQGQFLAHAGIYPSATRNYTYDEVMAALRAPRGVNATLECEDGALDSVYYTFFVKGSVADGLFVPGEPVGEGVGCPASIQYLPKNESSRPQVSPTTCPALHAVATASIAAKV